MAESTATTYLGWAELPPTGNEVPERFVKVCDIIDYPDLTSPAERIEVTTLSDKTRRYIKGIADQAEQTYTANFDRTQYDTIKGFGDAEKYWCILFSESKSVFYFKGQSHISAAGGGVGDVRKMNITLYSNTEPTLYDGDGAYDETTTMITLT